NQDEHMAVIQPNSEKTGILDEIVTIPLMDNDHKESND
ncbi:unnamed protein product, partial [Onchocerca ochengi]